MPRRKARNIATLSGSVTTWSPGVPRTGWVARWRRGGRRTVERVSVPEALSLVSSRLRVDPRVPTDATSSTPPRAQQGY